METVQPPPHVLLSKILIREPKHMLQRRQTQESDLNNDAKKKVVRSFTDGQIFHCILPCSPRGEDYTLRERRSLLDFSESLHKSCVRKLWLTTFEGSAKTLESLAWAGHGLSRRLYATKLAVGFAYRRLTSSNCKHGFKERRGA
ncbi:hypothetical protein MTO96_041777 [Rhipicephalus appendiculatus]